MCEKYAGRFLPWGTSPAAFALVALVWAAGVGFTAKASAQQAQTPPQVKGATTVNTVSTSGSGTPNAGQARQSGSGITGASSPGGGKAGFGCQTGEWGIQNGLVTCAVTTASMVPAFQGKTILVRATLTDGFISGSMIRLEGVANSKDVRVDLFDIFGALVKSCYLTVAGKACNLGSPGAMQTNLVNDPRYLAYGTGNTGLRYASDLVGMNLPFAGDRQGASLQDNYIASISITDTDIKVQVAGLYYLGGSQNGLLWPVYSAGSITLAQLNAMQSGETWVMPSGWSAPTLN